AENGFCDAFRKMLKVSLDLYLTLTEAIATYDLALAKWVDETPSCKKLMRLEGVGILNAIHLFINLS
ncbi:IS110 family transposase, partial [Pseudoalteromonas sp. NSLLW218]|nr:IS110 family transposase [Pseudoalteromonas sp. NSLLW218]